MADANLRLIIESQTAGARQDLKVLRSDMQATQDTFSDLGEQSQDLNQNFQEMQTELDNTSLATKALTASFDLALRAVSIFPIHVSGSFKEAIKGADDFALSMGTAISKSVSLLGTRFQELGAKIGFSFVHAAEAPTRFAAVTLQAMGGLFSVLHALPLYLDELNSFRTDKSVAEISLLDRATKGLAKGLLALTSQNFSKFLAFTTSLRAVTGVAGLLSAGMTKLKDSTYEAVESMEAYISSIKTDPFVAAATEFQFFEAKLKALTGSTESARQRLTELTQYAATTPFELRGIIDADIQLKTFGQDAQRFLPVAANLAVVAGRSIEDASYAVGKALSGIPEGLTMLQESFRITKRDLISFGKSMGLVAENGQIMTRTTHEVEGLANALEAVTKAKFGDVIKNKMESLGTAISNAEDALFRFKGHLGEVFAPLAKGGIQAVTATISLMEKMVPVAQHVMEALSSIKGGFENLNEIGGLKPILAAATIAVAAFTGTLIPLGATLATVGAGLLVLKSGVLKLTPLVGAGLATAFAATIAAANPLAAALIVVASAVTTTATAFSLVPGPFQEAAKATVAVIGGVTALGLVFGLIPALAGTAAVALEAFAAKTLLAAAAVDAVGVAAITKQVALTLLAAAAKATGLALGGLSATALLYAAGGAAAIAIVYEWAKAQEELRQAQSKYNQQSEKLAGSVTKFNQVQGKTTSELRAAGKTSRDVAGAIRYLQYEYEKASEAGASPDVLNAKKKEIQALQEQKIALAEVERQAGETTAQIIDGAKNIEDRVVAFNKNVRLGVFVDKSAQLKEMDKIVEAAKTSKERLERVYNEQKESGATDTQLQAIQQRAETVEGIIRDLLDKRIDLFREATDEQIDRLKATFDFELEMGKHTTEQRIAYLKKLATTQGITEQGRIQLLREAAKQELDYQHEIQDAALATQQAKLSSYEITEDAAKRALQDNEDVAASEAALTDAIKKKYAAQRDALAVEQKLKQERENDPKIREQNQLQYQQKLIESYDQEQAELRETKESSQATRNAQIADLRQLLEAQNELNQLQLAGAEKRFDRGEAGAVGEVVTLRKRLHNYTLAAIKEEGEVAKNQAHVSAEDRKRIDQETNAKIASENAKFYADQADFEIAAAQKVADRKLELLNQEQSYRESLLQNLTKHFERGELNTAQLEQVRGQVEAGKELTIKSEREKALIGISSKKEIARINSIYDLKEKQQKQEYVEETYDFEISKAEKANEVKQRNLGNERAALEINKQLVEDQIKQGKFVGDIAQERVNQLTKEKNLRVQELEAERDIELKKSDQSRHQQIILDYELKIKQANLDLRHAIEGVNNEYKKGTTELDKQLKLLGLIDDELSSLQSEEEAFQRQKEKEGPGTLHTLDELQAEEKRQDRIRELARERVKQAKEVQKAQEKQARDDAAAAEQRQKRSEIEIRQDEVRKQGVIDRLRRSGADEKAIKARIEEMFGAGAYETDLYAEYKKNEEKLKDEKQKNQKKGPADKDKTPAIDPNKPMTEATGQAILAELKNHTAIGQGARDDNKNANKNAKPTTTDDKKKSPTPNKKPLDNFKPPVPTPTDGFFTVDPISGFV